MNYIYKAVHPDQPEMFAAVVLASKPAFGEWAKPLVTLHLRYPRIIHGEIMTHRVFSRNARSSRAVPVKTMLNEMRTIPFVPWHWGKNQQGMQAAENWNADVILPDYDGEPNGFSREEAWLYQRNHAAAIAEAYMNAGYHKQIPNRLLEPFSWIDTLITSSSWANFFHLRDHTDAEPHFQDLARLVKEALTWVRDNDALQILEPGQWHLPYVTEADRHEWLYGDGLTAQAHMDRLGIDGYEVLRRVSAARCARISYTPFDGDPSYERELERFDFLINSDRLHASPTEHQATPDRTMNKVGVGQIGWADPELHGNLEGWIQFRKTLAGEYHDEDKAFWNAAA